jgi:uncharacterized protein YndB with AHSA1/START domain
LGKWWGPNGFTTTTSAFEFRAGGAWRFIMHGPDGRDYENHVTFDEIKPPHLIRYHHGGGGETAAIQFDTMVSFEPVGERTRLTLRAMFSSAEERERVAREVGAEEGGRQTIARLAEYVATKILEKGGADVFEIERWFDAPQALVWETMTEAKHLAHWWGPAGFSIGECSVDFRIGGVFHYCMRAKSGGGEMWGRFRYLEIGAPARLVYMVSFSDAEGGVTRAPFAGEWPLEMLNVVTLRAEKGGTRLVLKSCAYNGNEAERATFKEGFASMQGGFSGTYEMLEAYLAGLQSGNAE